VSSNTVNCPSGADFKAARERHQSVVAAWIPGVLEILNQAGTAVISRISGAVRVDESRLEMTDHGLIQLQRAFAMIAKEDLPDGLQQGVLCRIQDKGFKVAADPADNEHDASWVVELSRAHGSDL
jgi:hypothetical protein